MSRSVKPAAKTDDFDAWLKAPRANTRHCMTCDSGGPVLEPIAQYVERARAGRTTRCQTELHRYLVETFGYPLSSAALGKHIRECLKYKSRAR